MKRHWGLPAKKVVKVQRSLWCDFFFAIVLFLNDKIFPTEKHHD